MYSEPVAVIILTQCQVAVSELQARFIAQHQDQQQQQQHLQHKSVLWHFNESEFQERDSR